MNLYQPTNLKYAKTTSSSNMTTEYVNDSTFKGGLLDNPATPLDSLMPSSLPPFSVSGGELDESMQSEWSDNNSPSLADSLLSLDFESGGSMSTTLYNSDVLSDSSLSPVSTPKGLSATGPSLFAPVDAIIGGGVGSDLASLEHNIEPAAKRVRIDSPGAPVLRRDFTLFPGGHDEIFSSNKMPDGVMSPKAGVVMSLLDSLNASDQTSAAPVSTVSTAALSAPAVLPTSELALAPAPAPASVPPTAPSKPEIAVKLESGTKSFRGTRRRRRDVEELLPLDAPIQPRTYHTESATSRRDSKDNRADSSSPKTSADADATLALSEGAQDMDARTLKRLSNTIAARRSRHRKAEELKRLYETIERLEKEVHVWKERCEAAESERDSLRAGSVSRT